MVSLLATMAKTFTATADQEPHVDQAARPAHLFSVATLKSILKIGLKFHFRMVKNCIFIAVFI